MIAAPELDALTFNELTPAEASVFAQESLWWFTREIIDYRVGPGGQPRWKSYYPPLHRDTWCPFLEGVFTAEDIYSNLMQPRDSFKTTWMRNFLLWSINKYPDIRAMMAHGKLSTMKAIYSQLRWHCEYNPRLHAINPEVFDRPDLKKRWTTEALIVGRVIEDHTPTLLVTSVGSDTTAHHFHLFLFDDLVIRKNSRTKALRNEVKDWVADRIPELRPPDDVLVGGGRILDTGTTWSHDDAHKDFMHPDGRYFNHTRHLINGCFGEARARKGTLLFPTRLTKKFLGEKLDAMGPFKFGAQYCLDPTPQETKPFPEEAAQWFTELPDDRRYRVWMSLDPNHDEKSSADPMAIIVGAWCSRGGLWILDVFEGHPNGPQICQHVRRMMHDHGFPDLILEKTGFQNQLQGWFEEDMMEHNYAFVIRKVNRSGWNTKKERIVGMEQMWRTHRIHMRRGACERVYKQAIDYPESENDDMLEAMSDIHALGAKGHPRRFESERIPDLPRSTQNMQSVIDRIDGAGQRNGRGVRSRGRRARSIA